MERNVTLTFEEQLFGCPITCRVTRLHEGLHVLLVGGVRTHVGAVSTALPGEKSETRYFPGHKDQFVSEPWAEKLAEKLAEPVTVVCGIHYDDATKEQIREILQCTDGMLEKLMKEL